MKKLQHILYTFILVITCLTAPQVQAQTKDDSIEHLLQRVRVTFNQNNEQEFYDAIHKYRNYLLKEDDWLKIPEMRTAIFYFLLYFYLTEWITVE